MEKRQETRSDVELLLHLLEGNKTISAKTRNISESGCAIEISSQLKPKHGDVYQIKAEFQRQKMQFHGMVKWYRKELHRQIMGLHIINPPTVWAQHANGQPNEIPHFQLYFTTRESLFEEFNRHIKQGILEVSPTPRAPTINSTVAIDLYLPGQKTPELQMGKVSDHTPGGFHVRLIKPQDLRGKIEKLLG